MPEIVQKLSILSKRRTVGSRTSIFVTTLFFEFCGLEGVDIPPSPTTFFSCVFWTFVLQKLHTMFKTPKCSNLDPICRQTMRFRSPSICCYCLYKNVRLRLCRSRRPQSKAERKKTTSLHTDAPRSTSEFFCPSLVGFIREIGKWMVLYGIRMPHWPDFLFFLH